MAIDIGCRDSMQMCPVFALQILADTVSGLSDLQSKNLWKLPGFLCISCINRNSRYKYKGRKWDVGL